MSPYIKVTMVTENSKFVKHTYSCENCYYYTSSKGDYNKHLMTAKHIKVTNGDIKLMKTHACECGKEFKHRQGLSRHKKVCDVFIPMVVHTTSSNIEEPTEVQLLSNTIMELVKQNNDFKQLLVEQNKQMMELAGNAGNNHHNTTTNNNKFNLNFFLNETCKDAITMNEFITSMEVSMDDFIRTGNIGFVDGISKVMVERIKDMELHTRPMHCTDLKRETIYIKNEDNWEKEDNEKTHLRKAVKCVANKNYKLLKKWFDSRPDVEKIGSQDCEDYFKYYKASLGGYDKEEDKKFEEKIIKNIMKTVTINREPVIVT